MLDRVLGIEFSLRSAWRLKNLIPETRYPLPPTPSPHPTYLTYLTYPTYPTYPTHPTYPTYPPIPHALSLRRKNAWAAP